MAAAKVPHVPSNLSGASLGPALDSATSAASAATSVASTAFSAIPSGADIGQFIREQRQHAKLSLRRLAEDAGVSNPYLSQIERGLRKPSAEILQQLAKGLRISAEQLYVQAGLLEDRGTSQAVEAAIVSDVAINERQKRALLDIYASFVTENHSTENHPTDDAPGKASDGTRAKKSTRNAARKTARKSPTKRTAKAAAKSTTKTARKPLKKTAKKSTTKTAKKATRKSTKKTTRSTASATRSKA